MDKIAILCIDDEREVLDAITRDLDRFRSHFRVEPCESAADAAEIVEEFLGEGWKIGLVLADHLMPGTSGVDFLISLNSNPETAATRKVLVTAQAGLEDTVRAVNRAGLNHYVRKPWKLDELHSLVISQLTDFVLSQCDNPMPYAAVLDAGRILSFISSRGSYPPA
ncbi:MAG: response regulator [Planctomycetota bacterium]